MVFNSNKGFFLTLDDAAAPATLELPQQEAPAEEDKAVEAPAAVPAPAPTAVAKPAAKAQPAAPEAVSEAKAEIQPVQMGSTILRSSTAAVAGAVELIRWRDGLISS